MNLEKEGIARNASLFYKHSKTNSVWLVGRMGVWWVD